jgi:hypothetical protein
MSNALAISAVTQTLVRLLDVGINNVISGTTITSKPPDKARNGLTGNQVNLFLYQAEMNAAWRNMDMPRQVRPGETGRPPLPLNLYYLITAYGEGDEDDPAHRLLGLAMSLLHDHPLLGADEIEAALADSELHEQVERVRLTFQPLNLEEMSKLWTTFQTQYRISAAYQAAVVLIESTLPGRAALPVLRRGAADEGAFVLAGASPHLDEARPVGPLLAVRLGDDLQVLGQNLDGEGITARFFHPRLDTSLEKPPLPGATGDELRVHLPSTAEEAAAMAAWAPGFYTLALAVNRPNLPPWLSNAVPFALAPVITIAPASAPAGTVTLTVTCAPRLRDGQRARLLFGERQVEPQTVTNPADPAQPTSLDFQVADVAAGQYVVRLRVDGADSLPFVLAGTPPQLEFDPAQRVTVT